MVVEVRQRHGTMGLVMGLTTQVVAVLDAIGKLILVGRMLAGAVKA